MLISSFQCYLLALPCRYFCYLYFQLKTHAECFSGDEDGDEPALSLLGALGLLTIITIIVAINSE
jgi:Ca2+:H+ antiporter